MADKIAMMGFGNLTLFPIVENSRSAYSVGEGFSVPWVQEMTRDAEVSESKIYADDTIYLNSKSWNGMSATITVAEMPLKLFAELGFGEYNEAENTLVWNPQGKNLSFAASFRCMRADGNYRMMKLYCFTVNEIKEETLKTRGESSDITSYKITGMFTPRVKDGLPGEIHDGSDLEWLAEI